MEHALFTWEVLRGAGLDAGAGGGKYGEQITVSSGVQHLCCCREKTPL